MLLRITHMQKSTLAPLSFIIELLCLTGWPTEVERDAAADNADTDVWYGGRGADGDSNTQNSQERTRSPGSYGRHGNARKYVRSEGDWDG